MNLAQKSCRVLVVAALALFWAHSAWALDVRGYGVFKTQDFTQTNTNPPVLITGFGPYSWSALVQQNGSWTNQVLSASVEPASGIPDPLLPPDPNSELPFVVLYPASTQASVDASYPAGLYTFRISTAHDGIKTLRLNLPINNFPANAPRIANFSEAQVIDARRSFTLVWDAFSGGTTNDTIGLSLSDADGNIVFRSAAFPPENGHIPLNGTATSVPLPAGTLQPGRSYDAYLYFERDAVIDRTNYTGAVGLAGFTRATSFSISTLPEVQALTRSSSPFKLRLLGQPGKQFAIQTSIQLNSDWTSLVTNVATNSGYFDFSDAGSLTNSHRFYRGLKLP